MRIVPYKQGFTNSCLAACLLMLQKAENNIDFDQETEKEIWMKGADRMKYPFNVVGMPHEFSKKFDRHVMVFTDNKYFTNFLKNAFGITSKCRVEQVKFTIENIRKYLKQGPIICHIDEHILGSYSHCSHFVILEKVLSENKILVVDPWQGNKKHLTFDQLEDAILSLKNHVKMRPLIFALRTL